MAPAGSRIALRRDGLVEYRRVESARRGEALDTWPKTVRQHLHKSMAESTRH
jgi:hypothetical protein